jgi:hypothetical protein
MATAGTMSTANALGVDKHPKRLYVLFATEYVRALQLLHHAGNGCT